MNEIYLIEATFEYAEQVWRFRQEVFDYDNNSGSQFAGCLSLDTCSSAEEWIEMCQLRNSEKTCGQTGVDVPSHTYFAIRKTDNKLVGVIDLRHHINHPILGTWGGHCGYTVRPFERGNGRSSALLMAAEGHGFEDVVLYYDHLMEHLKWKNLGHVLSGGNMSVGDIKGKSELNDAYELGKSIK